MSIPYIKEGRLSIYNKWKEGKAIAIIEFWIDYRPILGKSTTLLN